jgi:hypothetical protein
MRIPGYLENNINAKKSKIIKSLSRFPTIFRALETQRKSAI